MIASPGARVADRAASRFLHPLVGAIGAAAAILLVAIYANLPSSPAVLSGSPNVSYEEFVAEWRTQPRVAIDLPSSDAKVTVVMFVDWLCAVCVRDWPGTLDIVKNYEHAHPGRVRLLVKDLPWNTACNPTSPQTLRGHEGSCDAAVAVRIADEMGRRDDLTDWFVANQRLPGSAALPPTLIRDHVAQTLGVEDFERRYREMLPAVIADADAALAAGVLGTPHWLVNRIHVSSLAILDMALRYELSQADGAGAAPASKR
jgi:hypothetical protein